MNVDANPSLDLLQNPILDPIKFSSSDDSLLKLLIKTCSLLWPDMVAARVSLAHGPLRSMNSIRCYQKYEYDIPYVHFI